MNFKVKLIQNAYPSDTNGTWQAYGFLSTENQDEEPNPTTKVTWVEPPVVEQRNWCGELIELIDWAKPALIEHLSMGDITENAEVIFYKS